MKASIAFGKCVNLVALSGYLLNIIGLLDSTSERKNLYFKILLPYADIKKNSTSKSKRCFSLVIIIIFVLL